MTRRIMIKTKTRRTEQVKRTQRKTDGSVSRKLDITSGKIKTPRQAEILMTEATLELTVKCSFR